MNELDKASKKLIWFNSFFLKFILTGRVIRQSRKRLLLTVNILCVQFGNDSAHVIENMMLPVFPSSSFRSKRSFRRASRIPEGEGGGGSLSAALLDPQPQRRSSTRQKSKKAILP